MGERILNGKEKMSEILNRGRGFVVCQSTIVNPLLSDPVRGRTADVMAAQCGFSAEG